MSNDSPAELAYKALEALLQNVSGLKSTVSRRLTDNTQVMPDNMPALFINETGEEIHPIKGFEGLNAKQILTCDLYLYCSNDKIDAVVSTQLNNMIYSVRQALAPSGGSIYQDLGGTVSHCWIEGKIETIEGVQDNQGFSVIPVRILTNV
jgi:hypothetical protein